MEYLTSAKSRKKPMLKNFETEPPLNEEASTMHRLKEQDSVDTHKGPSDHGNYKTY